ncbi:MAG: type II secretion system protein [Candidatus Babeliaceae bacterium]
MPGNFKRSGFSLLEIVVAIALMVLVATLVVPLFTRKKKVVEGFTLQLNGVLARVYTNALITGQVHKITWDFERDQIIAEKGTGEKSASGEDIFVPLSESYTKSSIKIPEILEIKNFFVQGKDELAGAVTKKAWFFIMPQGLAQSVIINIVDTDSDHLYGLVLNPFTVQVKLYDEFKKP